MIAQAQWHLGGLVFVDLGRTEILIELLFPLGDEGLTAIQQVRNTKHALA